MADIGLNNDEEDDDEDEDDDKFFSVSRVLIHVRGGSLVPSSQLPA
jgi:hypothetical protein